MVHEWSQPRVEAMTAIASEFVEIDVLAAVFPRMCSTGRFNRRTGPDQPVKGELKGLFRSLHDRTGRFVGTAGSFRSSTPRSIKTTHGLSLTAPHRAASDRQGRPV